MSLLNCQTVKLSNLQTRPGAFDALELQSPKWLDVDFGTQLLEGQHRKLVVVLLNHLAEVPADVDRDDDDGLLRDAGEIADRALDDGEDGADGGGVHGEVGAAGGLADRLADLLLERGVEEVGGDDVLAAGELVGDVARERGAHVLDEEDGVLLLLPPLDEGLRDALEVADGDASWTRRWRTSVIFWSGRTRWTSRTSSGASFSMWSKRMRVSWSERNSCE